MIYRGFQFIGNNFLISGSYSGTALNSQCGMAAQVFKAPETTTITEVVFNMVNQSGSPNQNDFELLFGKAIGGNPNIHKNNITLDATADNFAYNYHLLSNNDTVMFLVAISGAMPDNFTHAQLYYVVNATDHTFQLSASQGGAAIDIVGAGSAWRLYHIYSQHLPSEYNISDTVKYSPNVNITRGNFYYVGIRNKNAAPVSNFLSITRISGNQDSKLTYATGLSYAQVVGNDNSGGNDSTLFMKIKFNSGAIFGVLPDATDSFKLYGTQKAGVVFIAPATMNVIGLWTYLTNFNTIKTKIKAEIYVNNVLSGTSDLIPTTRFTSLSNTGFIFDNNISLKKGDTVKIIFSLTDNTGSLTSYVQIPRITYLSTDPDVLSFRTFGAYCTSYNGSTWTDSVYTEMPFSLITLPDSEFPASGGGQHAYSF